ncbi:MAG: hypothetical protein ACRDHZ_12050 [Ktedonobacteraceae bacterium]
MANTSSEKILSRLKGLRAQMREGEQPLFSIPAIWDNTTEKQSNACDLVLTNQRIFGYIYSTFPRARLFLDTVELDHIQQVSSRQKSFEAVFRELFVSDGRKNIYIRTTRKKLEDISAALHSVLAEHAPTTYARLDKNTSEEQLATTKEAIPAAPIFSHEKVQQRMERSPIGITLLLVGG